MKIRILALFISIVTQIPLSAQVKDIELLKAENGNEITYYAKSNVREALTVELKIEGSGFTPSVPLPATVDLKSFEKKELVKITLDPSGGSSYSMSYSYYKTGSKPQRTTIAPTPVADRPELKKGIVVFSKDGCGKCTYAKNYLTEKSIPFKEINISASAEDQSYFWKLLQDAGFKGSSVQTPVIMIDGKVHYDMDIRSFMTTIK